MLGGIAIAVGVFTYSKRVMLTVGSGLMPLSPVAAWVVVVSQSIVLFLFASQALEHFLASSGLPTIPLVPVSSSQAVVGAVIGIGLLKGGKGIKWRVLGNIASGWITTPIIACLVSVVTLYIVQNVFNQHVYRDASYVLAEPVLERLEEKGVDTARLRDIKGKRFDTVREFRDALREEIRPDEKTESTILDTARLDVVIIDSSKLWRLDDTSLTKTQVAALWPLAGRRFNHLWMLDDALAELGEEWRSLPATKVNKVFNRHLQGQRREVYDVFRVTPKQDE